MTSFAEVLRRARRAPPPRRRLIQDRSVVDAVSAGYVRLAAETPWSATPMVAVRAPSDEVTATSDAAVPLALRALGLDGRATAADVKRAFRRHALAAHPDQGGTSHAFRALLASYVEALELVGKEAA